MEPEIFGTAASNMVFTAAGLEGLSTNVTSLAVGLVAVALIGVAYYYVRKYLMGVSRTF